MARIQVINRFLQGVATRHTVLITRHFSSVSAKTINSPTDLSRQLNREIIKPKFASISQQPSQRKFSKRAKMVRQRHLLKAETFSKQVFWFSEQTNRTRKRRDSEAFVGDWMEHG